MANNRQDQRSQQGQQGLKIKHCEMAERILDSANQDEQDLRRAAGEHIALCTLCQQKRKGGGGQAAQQQSQPESQSSSSQNQSGGGQQGKQDKSDEKASASAQSQSSADKEKKKSPKKDFKDWAMTIWNWFIWGNPEGQPKKDDEKKKQ